MKTLLSLSLVALLVAPPAAQDGQPFIQPGDNLRVENIPPIPQSLVDETRPYTESRPALFGSWHPAKHEMLILTRFAETNQVHRVAAPGASRTQLTFFPDRVVDASSPPADRGFFVFSKDVGGGEWFQNYRFDEADGAITLLTDGKSRNNGGCLVTPGAPAGVHVHAADGPGHRHLRGRPRGSGIGPPPARGGRRRVDGARLVPAAGGSDRLRPPRRATMPRLSPLPDRLAQRSLTGSVTR